MKKKERWIGEPDCEGRYANVFKVGFNADVFVIDHYQYFPTDCDQQAEMAPQQIPCLRIITAPADAKQLFEHLKLSIADYEKANGVIGKPDEGRRAQGT